MHFLHYNLQKKLVHDLLARDDVIEHEKPFIFHIDAHLIKGTAILMLFYISLSQYGLQ